MSRIGKAPVAIPSGVTISVDGANVVTVKGSKGELKQQVDPDLKVIIEEGEVKIERPTEQKRHKSLHGLYRSLISNMVEGVSNGYTKQLSVIGVGYRATNTGNLLELAVGYSHPIYFMVPNELKIETISEKGKDPQVVLTGIDKQLLGQVAAKIRAFRKPEPYKGKGIRYKDEYVRRKAGKTVAK